MKPNPQDFYDYPAAEREGWFISHAAGNMDGTTWRLERDDESAIFDGDPSAHAHVVHAACNGDANAMKALIFLAHHEPREIAEIEKHAESAGVWDTDNESPWSYEFGTLAQEKLAAIRARHSGVWDHPALVFFGPLADFESDVLHILDTCPDDLRAYCCVD